MAKLTLSIQDDLLRRARIRALEQGTNLDVVLRRYLETYAGTSWERERAIEGVLRLAHRSGSGAAGEPWTRGDLHD